MAKSQASANARDLIVHSGSFNVSGVAFNTRSNAGFELAGAGEPGLARHDVEEATRASSMKPPTGAPSKGTLDRSLGEGFHVVSPFSRVYSVDLREQERAVDATVSSPGTVLTAPRPLALA
jgi:hypothetical protein